MKLSELQISELEIWLADGPEIDEIVERFTKLEEENKALREYVTHFPDCYENGGKCICELDALLGGGDDG